MNASLPPVNPTQLAFLFDNVADYAALANAFRPGVEVHVLDASQDGLAQIQAILQGRSGLDALHIVGHGSSGALNLGSVTLDARDIDAYDQALADIGHALAPGGDLLLYGCSVAAGTAGAQLVEHIAQASGADVAASTNLTGGAELGGDWTLEQRIGTVTADGAFDALAVHDLATTLSDTPEDVTETMNTGPGNFVPGFELFTNEVVGGDNVAHGIYLDAPKASETFAVKVDSNLVARFDLTSLSFERVDDGQAEYTIDITGYRNGALVGTATLISAAHTSTFVIADDFSDMTSLNEFHVTMRVSNGIASAFVDALTFDDFHVDHLALAAPNAPDLTASTDLGTSTTDNITSAATLSFTGSGLAGDSTSTAQVFIDTNHNGAFDPGQDVSATTTLVNGNWAVGGLSSASLADGAYDVYATVTAAGGDPSALSAPTSITIDHTGPTLTISSDKPSLLPGDTATITFTFSEDPGATFTWSGTSGDVVVNGGSLSPISGTGATRTATFTADSVHAAPTIEVAAASYTDTAGNAGGAATFAGISVDLDTTPPAAPSTPVLAPGSDTGDSPSDLLTKATTPTLEGTAEPGASVKLYDNGTQVGSGSADAGGNWAIGTATLAQGPHHITAVATDAAHNVGPASAALDFTVDTTAPTVTIATQPAALKIGDTAAITFTFTEDPGASFDAADIAVSGGVLDVLSGTGFTRSATFTPTAATNAGTASITVAAAGYHDAAGNAGTAGATPTLSFDTQAPTIAIDAVSHSLKAGETTIVSFDADESLGSGFSLADLAVSGGTLSNLSGSGAHWSAVFTPDADASGTAKVDIASSGYHDVAGNAGTAAAHSPDITFNTIIPALTITSDKSLLKAGETATITFTFSEDPGTSFTTGDVTVQGGALAPIAGTGLVRTAVFTPDAATNGGTGHIDVAAGSYTNPVGNGGSAGAASLAYDTLAPLAPTAVHLDAASDSGASNSDTITKVATPTFTGSAEAGATVTLYDGATAVGNGTADAGGHWAIPTAPLASNVHTLTAVATDAAGNASAASAGVQVTIDLDAPAAPSLSLAGSTVQVGNLESNATWEYSVDHGAHWQPGSGTTFTLPANASLSTEARQTDLAGNVSAAKPLVVPDPDDAGTTIYLGNGTVVYTGGAGDDRIGSGSGDDRLDGGAGNDLVAGGAGNDRVSGGAGADVLVGGRSTLGQWSFHLGADGTISATHDGAIFAPGGAETLPAADFDASLPDLQFLHTDPQKVSGIALLYGALDRAPDLGGLSFWATSGVSLQQVAQGILASPEFASVTPAHADDAGFVAGLYQQVLGRAPDVGGMAYWTGLLAGGDGHAPASRADVLVGIALSDEHRADATGAAGITIGQASVQHEAGWIVGSGDDTLDGGAGNDLLVGGDGIDTAVYAANHAQYHILIGADGALHVQDTANGDLDTLSGIELAQFKDGTLDIGFVGADPAQAARVGLMYEAVLDRAADAGGLKWWSSLKLDDAQLAQAFTTSPEFQARYAGLDNAAFVQALYANSGLDAHAAGGAQAWQDYLGQHTRAQLVAAWVGQDDVAHAQFGTNGMWLM